jgi:hypothetical protein
MTVKNCTKFLTLLLGLALAASASTIPPGTHFSVRMNTSLSSGTARVGDTFEATLVNPITVSGKTVAREGSVVRGKVTYVKPSGRLHAPGVLTVRLTSVEGSGQTYSVHSTPYSAKGKSHTKSNVAKIGGGAAAGAVIGALVGGGKGAAIGAGVGAGAGTGVAAATGKKEAEIPSEATLSFTAQ